MKGFTTKAIHGAPVKKDAHGTLRMPVYDSVAFEHETAENMQAAFEGRLPAHSYSRISNPTIEDFEQRVRLLADALGVIAVSSGMAAISNVILALAEAGTNIVTTRSIFGNTYSLFESTLRPWGLDISYVDLSNHDALAAALDENSRAVFLETITTPQLEVIDDGTFNWRRNPKGAPCGAKFGASALRVGMRADVDRNLGACLSPHNAYL